MGVRLLVVILALCNVALADDVPRCHNCFTSTSRSECHVRPELERTSVTDCRRGTKRCVTERHQSQDGVMISIRRRCSSRLESRFSYNRCDEQPDGTSRCLSYCRGVMCNRGTGRLYTTTRYWNYDSPDYADYVFDPEQAVLDPSYGGEARHAKHVQPDETGALAGGECAGARAAVVLAAVVAAVVA